MTVRHATVAVSTVDVVRYLSWSRRHNGPEAETPQTFTLVGLGRITRPSQSWCFAPILRSDRCLAPYANQSHQFTMTDDPYQELREAEIARMKAATAFIAVGGIGSDAVRRARSELTAADARLAVAEAAVTEYERGLRQSN